MSGHNAPITGNLSADITKAFKRDAGVTGSKDILNVVKRVGGGGTSDAPAPAANGLIYPWGGIGFPTQWGYQNGQAPAIQPFQSASPSAWQLTPQQIDMQLSMPNGPGGQTQGMMPMGAFLARLAAIQANGSKK